MKKTFLEEIQKSTLTASERQDLRERIVAYMEFYPLRAATMRGRRFDRYADSVRAFVASRPIHFRRLAGIVTALVFVTVPLVAEQSLPGDALYPVKVRFNEGIRSQLLFSPYEKMEWEARRVERRVAEARLLATEGELTEENEQMLEETVRSHASAFHEQLTELRESDSANATVAEVRLESALEVQSLVLNTEIGQEVSLENPNGGDISGLVEIVEQAQADITSPTDTDFVATIYDALIKKIEENSAHINELSTNLAGELTESQKADIQERMLDAEAAVERAKKAHEVGEVDEAVTLLRSAFAVTEKLAAFLSSFDLRANISLEALLPQEVPDESVGEVLDRATALFSKTYAALAAGIETLSGSRKEGALKQLEKLAIFLKRMDEHIAAKDFAAAERLAADAEKLILDLEETARKEE